MDETEKKERVMTIGIDKTEIPITGAYDVNKRDLEVQRQKEKYTSR